MEEEGMIAKIVAYVKARLSEGPSSHDWFHAERVWQMARFLQSREGGNLPLIEAAALLHCVAESARRRIHLNEDKRLYIIVGIFEVLDVPEDWRKTIMEAARLRFYSKDTQRPSSLESKIVQDAMFLDSVGATGIARAFAAGGYLGRPIYNPKIKPQIQTPKELYLKRKKGGSSVHYLYEKPLRLIDMLNTTTAKQIATTRLAFTNLFLEHFFKEWNLKDVESTM